MTRFRRERDGDDLEKKMWWSFLLSVFHEGMGVKGRMDYGGVFLFGLRSFFVFGRWIYVEYMRSSKILHFLSIVLRGIFRYGPHICRIFLRRVGILGDNIEKYKGGLRMRRKQNGRSRERRERERESINGIII